MQDATEANVPATQTAQATEVQTSFIKPLDTYDEERKTRIATYRQDVDYTDHVSLVNFVRKANEGSAEVAKKMIEGARNKDLGPAGEALNSFVSTIRGVNPDIINNGEKPGWFGRMLGKVAPVVQFMQQFEQAQGQIESLKKTLLEEQASLLRDIESLKRLYDSTWTDIEDIEDRCIALHAVRSELDDVILPKLAKEAEDGGMREAEKLAATRDLRDSLDRHLHDMLLTRQLQIQDLPSIRNFQAVDKDLEQKIERILTHAVNIWYKKIAQALLIQNTKDAADLTAAATDFTNQLIAGNAKAARETNKAAREAIERGVVDIEAIEEANNEIIGMIEDTLKITAEGREQRRQAEQKLIQLENDIKSKTTQQPTAA